MEQHLQTGVVQAQHHAVRGLGDAFARRPDVPALAVQRHPEALADLHVRGEDLDLAATVGEQLRDGWRMVEADLVHDHDPAGRGHRTVEDGPQSGDPEIVGVRPPRPGRAAPGGHDDHVGAVVADVADAHPDAGLHRHAECPQLGQLVADEVGELGPARDDRGQAHLPARFVGRLHHGDAVTGAVGADRRLHAGRPGADHQHVPRLHRCPEDQGAGRVTAVRAGLDGALGGPRRLPAGQRVLDTAEPAVQPHPSDAFLVARQAQPDAVGRPGAGQAGEVRVRDLPTHDPDQVTVPVGQCPVSLQRVFEPADTDHRKVHGAPDRRRDEQRVPGRDSHRSFDHVERRGGRPDRGVDVVDGTGRLDQPRHRDALVEGDAALDQFVAAQPHPESEPRADRGPHRPHDLAQQPGPVGERAAVVVGAPVRRR